MGRGRQSIFLGRGKNLKWGDLRFRNHVTLSYPYRFMSGHLYFPNNLKDHIQPDMISCEIFFQLMITVFKENLNLQPHLISYSNIRFVFETAFISEQIVEKTFGVLLKISDKFITKFNVFSNMILEFRLKTVWKISKPYCVPLKTSQVVLLESLQFVPQKLGMNFQKWEKN